MNFSDMKSVAESMFNKLLGWFTDFKDLVETQANAAYNKAKQAFDNAVKQIAGLEQQMNAAVAQAYEEAEAI